MKKLRIAALNELKENIKSVDSMFALLLAKNTDEIKKSKFSEEEIDQIIVDYNTNMKVIFAKLSAAELILIKLGHVKKYYKEYDKLVKELIKCQPTTTNAPDVEK